jgi:hypothetical protein
MNLRPAYFVIKNLAQESHVLTLVLCISSHTHSHPYPRPTTTFILSLVLVLNLILGDSEHSNIFRRFTSRNRTSSSSSSFSLSSTAESIPQSSTFSSLSTLVSPASDAFPGDVGGPPRKSSYPGNGSGSGQGLPSAQIQSNTGKQEHKTKSKSKSSKSTFPAASGNKTSSSTASEREWTRIKMVLRGNMGIGPNSGLAGAQRRSSAASAGTGGASSGSGSGVKVEVFDVSLLAIMRSCRGRDERLTRQKFRDRTCRCHCQILVHSSPSTLLSSVRPMFPSRTSHFFPPGRTR